MSKEETRIAYIGPALDAGTMDVRELAPAMLALGELCNHANEILTGHEKRVSVQVRSDFKAGSFEFAVLVEVLWHPIRDFFTSDDYIAARELIALLGIGASGVAGLLTLIKKLRGRKPQEIMEMEDGNVRLTLDNGEELIVPKDVLKLYNSPAVRKAMKKVVAPLETDGIEKMQIRDPEHRDQNVAEISKEDAPYYSEIPDSGEIIENQMELLLQPVTVHLEGESQWVFRRGGERGETLKAKITDSEFVRKMDTREISFRRGDIIRARVNERQWEEGGKLKTKYDIVEVLEYREALRQPPLLTTDDDSSATD